MVTEPAIDVDRIISMTELQKLSLRKLREMRLDEAPLVVRDNKRNQRRFVILDHESYVRLAGGSEPEPVDTARLDDVDFRWHGLLWDRPTMTNGRFAAILADREDPEHRWAWTRVLERLPSGIVTRHVRLRELRRILELVRPRPRIRAAWEGALEFWTDEARSRLA